MAQGQIGSGLLQVGISGVEPKQASGLAQDIGNLFGSVSKGVETYNTIGETAAKLEGRELTREVVSKLDELNAREQQLRPDDKDGRLNILNEIATLKESIPSRVSKFSDHKAAYDVISSMSADVLHSVRATELTMNGSFQKSNKLFSDNNVETSARQIGVRATKTLVDTGIQELLSTSMYSYKDAFDKSLSESFKSLDSDFSIANNSLTPTEKNKLLSPVGKGRFEGDPDKIVAMANKLIDSKEDGISFSYTKDKLDEKGNVEEEGIFVVGGKLGNMLSTEQQEKLLEPLRSLLGKTVTVESNRNLTREKAQINKIKTSSKESHFTVTAEETGIAKKTKEDVQKAYEDGDISKANYDTFMVEYYELADQLQKNNSVKGLFDSKVNYAEVAGHKHGYKAINPVDGKQTLDTPISIEDVQGYYDESYERSVAVGDTATAMATLDRAAGSGFFIKNSPLEKLEKLSKANTEGSMPVNESEQKIMLELMPKMVSSGRVSATYGNAVLSAIGAMKFDGSHNSFNMGLLHTQLSVAKNAVVASSAKTSYIADEVKNNPLIGDHQLTSEETANLMLLYPILTKQHLSGDKDQAASQIASKLQFVGGAVFSNIGSIIPISNTVTVKDTGYGLEVMMDRFNYLQKHNKSNTLTSVEKDEYNNNPYFKSINRNIKDSIDVSSGNYKIMNKNAYSYSVVSKQDGVNVEIMEISPEALKTYLNKAVQSGYNKDLIDAIENDKKSKKLEKLPFQPKFGI